MTLQEKLAKALADHDGWAWDCPGVEEDYMELANELMPIIRKHAAQIADRPMDGPEISGERLTQAYIAMLLRRME